MKQRPVITITTDFGYKDPFVGIIKGVILGINPDVLIIDITHGIAPQNVQEAAFTIAMSFMAFHHETIHMVVVDPGVGSERRPILVETGYHYFIGPDNGVFSQIYRLHEGFTVRHITAEHYFAQDRGSTFHGRDVFAPVAAWLSRGVDVSKFGDPITDYVSIPVPVPTMPNEHMIEGEVIYIDRFGNATTNIQSSKLDDLYIRNPEGKLKVTAKNMDVPLKDYYSQAEDNRLYSLINSFGYLELFVNRDSAASNFGIAVGEKVSVILT